MLVSTFGKKLKAARVERGLSQRSLGLSLGFSDKTISSYESGRSYPTLEILEKIATILDKKIDYFVCSDNEKSELHEDIKNISSLQKELDSKIESLLKRLSKVE